MLELVPHERILRQYVALSLQICCCGGGGGGNIFLQYNLRSIPLAFVALACVSSVALGIRFSRINKENRIVFKSFAGAHIIWPGNEALVWLIERMVFHSRASWPYKIILECRHGERWEKIKMDIAQALLEYSTLRRRSDRIECRLVPADKWIFSDAISDDEWNEPMVGRKCLN